MASSLDRYRKDLDALIKKGDLLSVAIHAECYPKEVETHLKQMGDKAKAYIAALPSFSEAYQAWYSESKVLIKQLLPDRLDDFVRHYENSRIRKEITYANYKIEDYLQGLRVTRGWEKDEVVGPDAAIPQFRQQLAILKSVQGRFETSLFDIRQLVQADLFDSELDAAMELVKNKFTRAAGAISGVVLERHLAQVCDNHSIKIVKKSRGISDLNDALKKENVIETPLWRFIQHLGDLRNLCDHDKKVEPTLEQVRDLIAGVTKVVKTLF